MKLDITHEQALVIGALCQDVHYSGILAKDARRNKRISRLYEKIAKHQRVISLIRKELWALQGKPLQGKPEKFAHLYVCPRCDKAGPIEDFKAWKKKSQKYTQELLAKAAGEE
jgi:hypothetical protein